MWKSAARAGGPVPEEGTITAEHRRLRTALEHLAANPGGRRLLQLAVRGLEAENVELAAGCWTRRGDAGCLFQHSYWQGVREGVFDDDGDARAWVSRVAGRGGWPRVIEAIAAFDHLAKARYRTGAASRLPGRGRRLDAVAWRATVLSLALEALDTATGPTAPPTPVMECAGS